MTDLLFHKDSYLREFEAMVADAAENSVALDRTAFYIGGGGQPHDTGVLVADGLEYPPSLSCRHSLQRENPSAEGSSPGERRAGPTSWAAAPAHRERRLSRRTSLGSG